MGFGRALSAFVLVLVCGRAGAQANLTAAWQSLGPYGVASAAYGTVSGRVTAVAVDPNDTTGNTVYLGTANGGVWKSTNAAGTLSAVTFTPLTDNLPVYASGGAATASLSIGAVTVQPQANPVILAGTGEANGGPDSLYGEGLLRSTDGGLTWTLVQGSRDGANGNHSWIGLATAGIVFSGAAPSTVVMAMATSTLGAAEKAAGTSSVPGLYYSSDAGVTWKMATIYDGATVVQQPVPAGTAQAGNAATAVVWDGLRQRFYAAVRWHGYYSSADGATWTRLAAQPGAGLTTANCPVGVNGAGSASCPIFRGVLAVQAATGDLYALTVDAQNNDQGLWQDLCAATGTACANAAPVFANRIDGGALEVGSGSTLIVQAGYDLTLAAAPVIGGTNLYAGTVDVFRCVIATGSSTCALRNTTNALNGCNAPAKVSPSQHALTAMGVSGGTGPLVFVGNDGGLWRSTDGIAQTGAVCSVGDAAHFDNLNAAIGTGGSLAQTVGFAQDPASAETLLAGLAANGSAATTGASAAVRGAWPQMSAGEGGYPLLDQATPMNWTLAIGAAVNFKRCTLGGKCTAADFTPPATVGEPQVAQDAALLHAPVLLDPASTSEMLLGTCRVWRGPAGDGSAWSVGNAISPSFAGAGVAVPCTAASPLVRSLGAGGTAITTSAVATSGSTVLYAGIAGVGTGAGSAGVAGHVFVTQHADTASSSVAWTDVAGANVTNDAANGGVFNPQGFDVTSLAVDTHDATGATVYATVSGFGVPHVYRSTDFGAHWLNVSANLPNVPANSVVVDPNDANTVYVALDTGVYVTQQISSCAGANCWSVLGTGLPQAPVSMLATGAALPTGDGRNGELRAGTYGRGIWQTPLLTAASNAKPAITLSAMSFDFGSVAMGTQSSAQTLTITSSGNAPVTFGTPAITGDFSETDTCAGKTLAVGQACTATLIFAPTAQGPRSGVLTIFANVSGGQAQVTLTGNGTAQAAIVLTPTALNFAATPVNQTSAAQTINIANTGGTSATLTGETISGDFVITANTCGPTLAAQDSCTVSIAFKPAATGARSGAFTVVDSVGTQTASLNGSGQANATDGLAPLALTFAQQQIGSSSAAQTVTLTNDGDIPLTLVAASISNGDFSVVSGCGNSLAAHSTCALRVTFTPTAAGARTGTLTVTDQFRSQTVALTGSGVAGPGVSLTPTVLSFAATGVGLVSAAQAVTLTNNGGSALTIASTTVAGPFAIASTTCGATLAAGSACTVSLVFAPAAGGAAAGSLMVQDNAVGGGTQTVALSGVGVDFTLAANGPTSITVASGGTATYGLLLSSAAGLSGTVALTCAGAPAHSTCTVAPASAALGGTQTVTVTVQTGLAKASAPGAGAAAFVLGGCLLLLVVRRRRFALVLMIAVGLGVVSGCGAGKVNPLAVSTPVPTPTPSGTYGLTVTGSAAGLSRTVGLTLVVQ